MRIQIAIAPLSLVSLLSLLAVPVHADASPRPVIAGDADDDEDQVDRREDSDDRSVRGTTPWGRYQVEVEVDPNAVDIAFGCTLSGDGTAWFDSLAIEVDGKPLAEALATKPTRAQAVFGLDKGYRLLSFANIWPQNTKVHIVESTLFRCRNTCIKSNL